MKKRIGILIILVAVVFVPVAWGGDLRKGYRGFVDANADLSFGRDGWGDRRTSVYYGLSTSHGYQINPHFFVGAGVMYERYRLSEYNDGCEFPVFLHTRTEWTFGRFPLYGDVRIGGVILGHYRLYFSPTVGYRLNLGRKCNLNFGIGMNFRGYAWYDEKTLHPQLALRVGIDF
ncbi:MAG: hypothetical protein K2K55_09525 [Duncaniella sp.]|nr:hypothetical protein [Duncaniella sp.]